MDIVTVLKHSRHDDLELRFSLSSIDRFAPWVGKVWILGDRPAFITDDTALIEQVAEDYTAAMLGLRPPVRNMFLLMALSSLIPELSFEYMYFSDDYFLLKDFPIEEARYSELPRWSGRYQEGLMNTWRMKNDARLFQQGFDGILAIFKTPR